jgi:ribosomal protein L37E
LTVREPFDILIVKEEKPMKDSEVWGFEWDDIEQAAKEMRESTFGPDRDIPANEKFCFNCGETSDMKDAVWCEFCGYGYDESRKARKYMACYIDVAWKLMNEEEKFRFKRELKALRSVSPEFRQMWQKEADLAALKRRYA